MEAVELTAPDDLKEGVTNCRAIATVLSPSAPQPLSLISPAGSPCLLARQALSPQPPSHSPPYHCQS